MIFGMRQCNKSLWSGPPRGGGGGGNWGYLRRGPGFGDTKILKSIKLPCFTFSWGENPQKRILPRDPPKLLAAMFIVNVNADVTGYDVSC